MRNSRLANQPDVRPSHREQARGVINDCPEIVPSPHCLIALEPLLIGSSTSPTEECRPDDAGDQDPDGRNHEGCVHRRDILSRRPDGPIERLPAVVRCSPLAGASVPSEGVCTVSRFGCRASPARGQQISGEEGAQHLGHRQEGRIARGQAAWRQEVDSGAEERRGFGSVAGEGQEKEGKAGPNKPARAEETPPVPSHPPPPFKAPPPPPPPPPPPRPRRPPPPSQTR